MDSTIVSKKWQLLAANPTLFFSTAFLDLYRARYSSKIQHFMAPGNVSYLRIGGMDVGSWMKNPPPSSVIFAFFIAWMLTRRIRMRDRMKPSSQVQNPADCYGSSLQAVKGSLCQAP